MNAISRIQLSHRASDYSPSTLYTPALDNDDLNGHSWSQVSAALYIGSLQFWDVA